MCGRGLEGPWSGPVDAETLYLALVGPWQYQSEAQAGCWLGTTPPLPTRLHHPRYYPSPPHTLHEGVLMVGTAVLTSAKEILGVDNARVRVRSQYPRHSHCERLLIGTLQQAPYRRADANKVLRLGG